VSIISYDLLNLTEIAKCMQLPVCIIISTSL